MPFPRSRGWGSGFGGRRGGRRGYALFRQARLSTSMGGTRALTVPLQPQCAVLTKAVSNTESTLP